MIAIPDPTLVVTGVPATVDMSTMYVLDIYQVSALVLIGFVVGVVFPRLGRVIRNKYGRTPE